MAAKLQEDAAARLLVDLDTRNDPCWCGSGRRFRSCHGAASPTLRRARNVVGPSGSTRDLDARLAAVLPFTPAIVRGGEPAARAAPWPRPVVPRPVPHALSTRSPRASIAPDRQPRRAAAVIVGLIVVMLGLAGAGAGVLLSRAAHDAHHVSLPSLSRLASLAQVLELPVAVASLIVALLAYRIAAQAANDAEPGRNRQR
jgi:hypothetical protein